VTQGFWVFREGQIGLPTIGQFFFLSFSESLLQLPFFINESLILFFQQFDAILSSLEFVVLLFSPKQK
jgi:hypothetical protein